MENKNSSLAVILQNRQALMGLAIIWIYFFHAKPNGILFIDSINSVGWIGVDIFIFLSAVGLSCSLNKNSLMKYYKNRVLRIIPTWMTVLVAVHVIGVIGHHFMPGLPFHYPTGLKQCLLWYSGLGFWLSPVVGYSPDASYEWYVPAILMFYIIAPLFFKCNLVQLISVFFVSIVLVCLQYKYECCLDISIAISRLPIFIMGFIFYKFCKDALYEKQYIISTVVIGGIMCILHYYELVVLRIVLAFILPLLLILFSYSLLKVKNLSLLTFAGSISLEIYLLHLHQRPYFVVSQIVENVVIANVVTLVIVVIISYLLNRLMKFVLK